MQEEGYIDAATRDAGTAAPLVLARKPAFVQDASKAHGFALNQSDGKAELSIHAGARAWA